MKTLIESKDLTKTTVEYFSGSSVRTIKQNSNNTLVEYFTSNKKVSLTVRSIEEIDLTFIAKKTATFTSDSNTFVSFQSGNKTRIELAIEGPPGPPGPPGPSNPSIINAIEYKVIFLSDIDIENKFFLLDHNVKDPEFTQLIVESGIEQIPFRDYNIINNRIAWESLALENLLEVGDRVIIRYYKE